MKQFPFILTALAILLSSGQCSVKSDRYDGTFCSGKGDTDYLRLIDESFAFFHPNPVVPNLTMVYKPEWDTFAEGAGWDAWWIQNSYGGVRQSDGTFGKGYLTGLSITYLAALDRMVELYKLTGDQEKLAEYEYRQKITRESLPRLLTPEGYFVKSLEPGGIRHGVLGQEQFGYLEGVANADAVALRVVDDIRRSATRAMRWSKDFRMDAPWSQRGENTSNPWSDTGGHRVGGVAVMIDNFAIPAATIRGLFDFDCRYDRLILHPRVPGTITQYIQKQPVRFGEKKLYISCNNDGPDVKSVKVNGKVTKIMTKDEVYLIYDELPVEAKIEITTTGGWPEEPSPTDYPMVPSLLPEKNTKNQGMAELPESLKKPANVLTEMKRLMKNEPDSEYDMAFIDVALKACEDYRVRVAMDPGPGYYRSITQERKEGINNFYEQAALSLYNGFTSRMDRYARNGDIQQKRIAELFDNVKL